MSLRSINTGSSELTPDQVRRLVLGEGFGELSEDDVRNALSDGRKIPPKDTNASRISLDKHRQRMAGKLTLSGGSNSGK